MLDKILRFFKKIIPRPIFEFFQPTYHYLLALGAALVYGFPSRKIKIVAVTGTKGKTTTVEILGAILEEAGYKVALSSTLRFKVGKSSHRNMYKMTLPGRFFVQRFIKKAVNKNCDYIIMEVTSEAVKQFRHKFLSLDALIFTNLSPEHIESHGSYENYVRAKLKIGEALAESNKRERALVVNGDDEKSELFLKLNIPEKLLFSLEDAKPFTIKPQGINFTFRGKKIESPLSGKFNLYNILGAATYAHSQNIPVATIKQTLEKFQGVRGRVEEIDEGQDFKVIVDYAHTPDSLEKLYKAFKNQEKICVLGNTGGGRDKWKRKDMAEIAEKYCSYIILTNEDPYDEDPLSIVKDMAKHIKERPYEVIMDRREAISRAIKEAESDDVVLITGKGTDPYIMGPSGEKTPWDDAKVTREELRKHLSGNI